MKRVGPELKMPKRGDLKVPRVVSDLYWDLRDRHLLPIVALLIVAIIAAPILLGSGSGPSGPKRIPPINAGGGATKDAKLTVVTAEPGLRDPKKRFAHRNPTNPFKQRFTGPQIANAEENAVETVTEPEAGGTVEETITIPLPESSGSASPPTSPGNPTVPNGPSERGGGESGGGSPGESELPPGEIHYFNWTATVQVSHTETAEDGSTKMSEPELRKGIKTLTTLPGPKLPVVTFLGGSPTSKSGLFVVSKEVTAIYGEAECVSGASSCDLVKLEPHFPVVFEYGPAHVRWKINLISTKLTLVKDPSTDANSARISASKRLAGP